MKQTPISVQLEQVLFDFEKYWLENKSATIEQFLPDPTSQNYLEILTELVRSEMEFRIENGQKFSAAEYFDRFPALVKSLQSKTAVVFEEYRLRNGHGENVLPDDVAGRYQIDATGWPDLHSAEHKRGSSHTSANCHSKARKQIVFPKVGDSFLDFELVGQLGEGAFGKVFLAQQGELADRLVVLKFTSVITDEHQLLARLQHTHIVPIHSVHRMGDLQAICMPLLGVATLNDILVQCMKPEAKRASIQSNALVRTVNQKRELTIAETIDDEDEATRFRSRLPLAEVKGRPQHHRSLQLFAATFIQQTAEGLGYAHQKGIIHCDLKPANILVDDDGNAVILDFHLGHSLQENMGHHVGGTLPYMAPEHLRALERDQDAEQLELEPSSDVYSLGVMLYEILLGKLPHETKLSENMFSLEELAKEKMVRFSVQKTERKLIGEDLASIIETCLEPNPKKRFQNGNELAHDLERFLNFEPLKHTPNRSLGNRLQKWAKRNPRLSSGSTILVASSLLIAAAVVAFLLVNNQLDRLKAIATSENHIDSAQSLIPVFTTARGLYDPSYFPQAIERADQVLKQNEWQDKNEFETQAYLRRLEPEHTHAEMVSAAELYFWLAEACQHLAMSTERERYLQLALEHNQSAKSFWPVNLSKNSLVVQGQIVRALLSDDDVISVSDSSKKDQDNRVDRILTAYLRQRSDATESESVLDRLVEEETEDFDAWLLLGHTSTRLGKFEKAQTCYTVCRSIDPSSSLPLFCRGISKMEQGQLKSALVDLKLANQLSPDDVTITLNLALAFLKNRDFENAKTGFDRAIELGAQNTRVWYLRSGVKKRLGDVEGSRKDLEVFLELVPNDEKSCITRGLLRLKNSPQLAIEDFERALEFDPQSATAYNNLAYVYSEVLNKPEKGIELMANAIEIAPASPKFHASRGVLLGRIGQRKEAHRDAETALRLDRSPDTLYQVAGLYAQTSKVDPVDRRRAISLFAEAAFKDPKLVLKKLQGDPDIEPIGDDESFTVIVDAINKMREIWRENNKS